MEFKFKLDKRFAVVNGSILGTKGEKKAAAKVQAAATDKAAAAPATGGGAAPAAEAAVAGKTYKKSTLTPEGRLASIMSVGEEVIQAEELEKLLSVKDHPVCYDGFEPSGRVHLAQGILKAINVRAHNSCVLASTTMLLRSTS